MKPITAIPSAIEDRPRPTWAGAAEPFEVLLDRADQPEPEQLDGVALARALLDLARWGAMAPAPEVRAVAAMISDWAEDGVAVPLDRWLGTSAAGRGSMREQVAIVERDVVLRAVARGPSYAGLSPTAAAGLMAARWRRWQAAGRQVRDDEGRAYARLAQIGYPGPLHPETIRKILAREAE
jgi:hypothetical protein